MQIDVLVYSASLTGTGSISVSSGGVQIALMANLTRGLNVAVVDKTTGQITQQQAFDTSSDPQASANVATMIQALPDGTIVCIAVQDDAQAALQESAKAACESLGSVHIRELAFRGCWALIGQKNASLGMVPELVRNGGHEPVVMAVVSRSFNTAPRPVFIDITSGGSSVATPVANIAVNGRLLGHEGYPRPYTRGLIVAGVDPANGEVHFLENFDTSTSPSETARFTSLLQRMPYGMLVCLTALVDAKQAFTDAAAAACVRLGSAAVNGLEVGSPWALIGLQNAALGTVPEAMQAQGTVTLSHVFNPVTVMPPNAVPAPSPQLVAVRSELTQSYRVATPFSSGRDAAVTMGNQTPTQTFSIDQAGNVISISLGDNTVVTDLHFPGVAKYLAVPRSGVGTAPLPTMVFAVGVDNTVRRWDGSWSVLPPLPMANTTDSYTVRGVKVGYDQQRGVYPIVLCQVMQKGQATDAASLTFFLGAGTGWLGTGTGWTKFTVDASHIGDWVPTWIQRPSDGGAEAGVFFAGALTDGRTGLFAWGTKSDGGGVYSAYLGGDFSGLVTADGRGDVVSDGVFAISGQDGRIVSIAQSGTTLAVQTVATGAQVTALAAIRWDGSIVLAALGADGDVHITNRGAAGLWSAPVAVGASEPLHRILGLQFTGIALEIYGITGDNGLHHLTCSSGSSTWSNADLTLPTAPAVDDLRSYVVDIMLFEAADDIPSASAPVQIFSEHAVRLEINGRTCLVDRGAPWTGLADDEGKVVIHMPASSLGAPVLSFWTTFMPTADRITLHPSGGTQAFLQSVTADYLLHTAKQTDETGVQTPLLPDSTNPNAAASVVSALQKTFGFTLPGVTTAPCFHRLNQTAVTRYVAGGSSQRAGRVAPAVPTTWQLDMTSGVPVYSEPTLTTRTLAAPLVHWSLGDLIDAVEAEAAVIVRIGVEAGEKITAVVHTVINGITYALHHPLLAMEDLWHLGVAAFRMVGLKLKQLWNWLGMLFQWDDILRSHEVVLHMFNETLVFAEALAPIAKKMSDAAIAGLRSSVEAQFDDFVQRTLATPAAVGAYRRTVGQAPVDQEVLVRRGLAMNPFHHGMRHHLSRASGSGAGVVTLDPTATSALDQLASSLQGIGQGFATGQVLAPFSAFALHFVENPQRALDGLIAGLAKLVKAVALAAIDVARKAVDALCDAIAAALAAIRALLNATIEIPFVSALYRRITATTSNPTGSDLSLADLVCLVAAVPATMFFKLRGQGAPFPDAAAVQAGKNSVMTADLLARMGLGPRTPQTRSVTTIALFAQGLGLAVGATFIFVDQRLDAFPPEVAMLPNLQIPLIPMNAPAFPAANPGQAVLDTESRYSIVAYAQGILGFACGLPWIEEDTHIGWEKAQDYAQLLYLIQLGGIVMDGFWLFRSLSTGSARSGRNAGILSTIMTSVWGLLNIALSIASAWKEGFDDVLGLISGTFANVPVTCKFVRLLYYVPEINAAALKVLRVVDVVFDTAAFALDLASYIKKATATPAPAAA